MDLNQAIEAVRESRAKFYDAKALQSELQKILEAASAYRAVDAAWDVVYACITEVDALEATLRELTIAEYERTGNKAPAEGVGIRVKRGVVYAKDIAHAWIRKNMQVLLKPDWKGFETYVKSSSDLDGVPAEIVEVVTATIAKEL